MGEGMVKGERVCNPCFLSLKKSLEQRISDDSTSGCANLACKLPSFCWQSCYYSLCPFLFFSPMIPGEYPPGITGENSLHRLFLEVQPLEYRNPGTPSALHAPLSSIYPSKLLSKFNLKNFQQRMNSYNPHHSHDRW